MICGTCDREHHTTIVETVPLPARAEPEDLDRITPLKRLICADCKGVEARAEIERARVAFGYPDNDLARVCTILRLSTIGR